jgi:predicted Holliday junction resolvase-like endonuclease
MIQALIVIIIILSVIIIILSCWITLLKLYIHKLEDYNKFLSENSSTYFTKYWKLKSDYNELKDKWELYKKKDIQ